MRFLKEENRPIKTWVCELVEDLHWFLAANLPYLTCVIKEAMRLKPVAWLLVRWNIEPLKLPGCADVLPPHTIIVTNVYGMHRDPKYWKDPEEFKPERFSSDAVQELNSWSYMPFCKHYLMYWNWFHFSSQGHAKLYWPEVGNDR